MSRMPVLFVGHGSPMNAVEDNAYTAVWKRLPEQIQKPKAILCVSAHWYTQGTRTQDALHPRTVYDMYGFPPQLYQVKYPASGAPDLAHQLAQMLPRQVDIDNEWGVDHGTWSVLCRMYPKADIPVYQLSVDLSAPASIHYALGQALSPLREEGILLMGSGNVVHNLGLLDWSKKGGFTWAVEFDAYIRDRIVHGEHEDVVHYEKAGESSRQAFYTPDHFYPLLYVLGACEPNEKVHIFNESCLMGSLSMTGYLIGDTI